MPTWANGKLVVYHGTDTQSLAAHGPFPVGSRLVRFAASLAHCRPVTDFGLGFYTTTSLHQAREWANARVRRLPAKPAQPQSLVLQFDLDRDWLAGLDSLVFVRAISDYWDFIAHCRAGLPIHARPMPRTTYDVVYGLVTIWPSRLLIQDCDQISFHTTAAVGGLNKPSVADVANTADGLFP